MKKKKGWEEGRETEGESGQTRGEDAMQQGRRDRGEAGESGQDPRRH